MTFRLPWPNVDIDIHPNPPEGWARIAVACGWNDAKKARERWPHAAVVGPLRTLRGIDLLVRSLLANPQIRVLVWDGPDLTPGEATRKTLLKLWAREVAVYGSPDLDRKIGIVIDGVQLCPGDADRHGQLPRIRPVDADRAGGAILLPPPAPKPTAHAPHGDPGDRIAGDTLADVWPRVLERSLTCGREAPSQYGATREMLNLVSVIRDPAAAQFGGILPHSHADAEAYYERLTGPEIPDGAAYSYGSRMTGQSHYVVDADGNGWYWEGPSQIERANEMLSKTPGTRAAFLTPWVPVLDAGQASGRPCLVGAWLSATPPLVVKSTEAGRREAERLEQKYPTLLPAMVAAIEQMAAPRPQSVLHLTVCFRSHDLFGAYPLNLAACALWLCATAKRHNMAVGALTCLSMSAHIYERDYAAAQKIAEAYKPPPGPRWDPRTTWRVERTDDGLRAVASAVERVDEAAPIQGEVVAVLEAKTPETLLRRIAESGLCQEAAALLWLGGEVERVWRGHAV